MGNREGGTATAIGRLRITHDGAERTVDVFAGEATIGRAAESDICIPSAVVSRLHAKLVCTGREVRFVQLGKTNVTKMLGAPVSEWVLRDGDVLEIGADTPEIVTLTFEDHASGLTLPLDATQPFRMAEARAAAAIGRVTLPVKGSITLGRAPECDLVLPSLSVSRIQARLEIEPGGARLVDLESANGTYVNGAAIQSSSLLPGDVVRIGPYKLVYRDGVIEHHDDSRSVRLDVHVVSRRIGKAKLLDGISFGARPGEVLAIAGTSGAGKSTLIDALNGSRRPTSGRVLINGADLYRAYSALRPLIGFVPQATILPGQLSARRALYYVARLRLPPDLSAEDAYRRVDDVLRDLDLYHRRDVPIEKLSGGQQKRASIAAELLANPGLLYLDEPTSGLDPGLTRRATSLLRSFAEAGSTIVIVTHDVESIVAADRLVFLAAGGQLVFNGTPTQALEYFGVADFAEIYRMVESGDATEWAEKFRASSLAPRAPAQIAAAEGDEADRHTSWDPISLVGAGVRRGSSVWRQFRTTTMRYIETMLRDRRNLALLLLQAPLIALVLALVSAQVDMQPPPAAAIEQASQFGIPAAKLAAPLALMLAASATWFGAINASREIVKELPILRREWLAGLRIPPYMASKVCVLMVLCIVQTVAMLAVVATRVDLPSSGALLWPPLEMSITLALAAFAALGLGLVISASVSNPDRAQSLVPILLIPQLIFAGDPTATGAERWFSFLTITHWSTEALKITAGIPYDNRGGGFEASDLLFRWGVMALMTVVFVGFAGWNLRRQQSS